MKIDSDNCQQIINTEKRTMCERDADEFQDMRVLPLPNCTTFSLARRLLTLGAPAEYRARLTDRGSMQKDTVDVDDTCDAVFSMSALRLMVEVEVRRRSLIDPFDLDRALFIEDLENLEYGIEPEDYYAELPFMYPIKEEVTTSVHDRIREFDGSAIGGSESSLLLHHEDTADGMILDARKKLEALLIDIGPEIDNSRMNKNTLIEKSDSTVTGSDPENSETRPLTMKEKRKSVQLSLVDRRRYREAVDRLNYVVAHGRSDLATSVSQLNRRIRRPRKLHWILMMRVIEFLSDTEAKQTSK